MLAPETRRAIERSLLVTCFFRPVLGEVQQARRHMSGQARRLLDAMLATPTQDGKPDVALLHAHLRATVNGDIGIALEYLKQVIEEPANSAHVADYIAYLAHDDRLLEAESACTAAAAAIREGDGEARVREHLEAARTALETEHEATEAPPLDIAAIMAGENVEATPWVVQGLFAEQDSVLLAGEGGTGKSIVALDLAIALVTGQPLLDLRISRPYRVLYVDEENPPHEIRRRIKQHLTGRGIADAPDGLTYLLHHGHTLRTAEGWSRLSRAIDAARAEWIVLDSLIRFLGGLDEDSNTQAAEFYGHLKHERVRSGCGFIILAHFGKPSKERSGIHRVRGAGDWTNSSDQCLTLEGDRESDVRTLTPQQRRTQVLPPMMIAWRMDETQEQAKLMALGSESKGAEQTITRALEVSGVAGLLRKTLLEKLEADGYQAAGRMVSRVLGRLGAQGTVVSEREGNAIRVWLARNRK